MKSKTILLQYEFMLSSIILQKIPIPGMWCFAICLDIERTIAL